MRYFNKSTVLTCLLIPSADMIRKQILFMSVVLLPLLFCAGCGDKEAVKKIDLYKVEEIKDISPESSGLRIGLVPEEDIRTMAARFEPLAGYLSKKLNRKLTFVYLDNYGEVCDRFMYNQLDAAFFGSFSYALTHAKAGVEPIARADYQDTSTYRGLMLVREGSGIKTVADMKGKRLALVHQATYAGYLYPWYYFKENAVKDLNAYFSKVIFAGSHDKAISAVLRNSSK